MMPPLPADQEEAIIQNVIATYSEIYFNPEVNAVDADGRFIMGPDGKPQNNFSIRPKQLAHSILSAVNTARGISRLPQVIVERLGEGKMFAERAAEYSYILWKTTADPNA